MTLGLLLVLAIASRTVSAEERWLEIIESYELPSDPDWPESARAASKKILEFEGSIGGVFKGLPTLPFPIMKKDFTDRLAKAGQNKRSRENIARDYRRRADELKAGSNQLPRLWVIRAWDGYARKRVEFVCGRSQEGVIQASKTGAIFLAFTGTSNPPDHWQASGRATILRVNRTKDVPSDFCPLGELNPALKELSFGQVATPPDAPRCIGSAKKETSPGGTRVSIAFDGACGGVPIDVSYPYYCEFRVFQKAPDGSRDREVRFDGPKYAVSIGGPATASIEIKGTPSGFGYEAEATAWFGVAHRDALSVYVVNPPKPPPSSSDGPPIPTPPPAAPKLGPIAPTGWTKSFLKDPWLEIIEVYELPADPAWATSANAASANRPPRLHVIRAWDGFAHSRVEFVCGEGQRNVVAASKPGARLLAVTGQSNPSDHRQAAGRTTILRVNRTKDVPSDFITLEIANPALKNLAFGRLVPPPNTPGCLGSATKDPSPGGTRMSIAFKGEGSGTPIDLSYPYYCEFKVFQRSKDGSREREVRFKGPKYAVALGGPAVATVELMEQPSAFGYEAEAVAWFGVAHRDALSPDGERTPEDPDPAEIQPAPPPEPTPPPVRPTSGGPGDSGGRPIGSPRTDLRCIQSPRPSGTDLRSGGQGE